MPTGPSSYPCGLWFLRVYFICIDVVRVSHTNLISKSSLLSVIPQRNEIHKKTHIFSASFHFVELFRMRIRATNHINNHSQQRPVSTKWTIFCYVSFAVFISVAIIQYFQYSLLVCLVGIWHDISSAIHPFIHTKFIIRRSFCSINPFSCKRFTYNTLERYK